jgi:uncharacterized protein
MADVFIAAAPGEDAQARGLAEALAILGFDAGWGTPAEADFAKTADSVKCVTALWSRGASSAPWLAALGVLALERKKLVCAETERGATPAPLQAAARVDLAARDRAAFKAGFQALVAEIGKFTDTKGDADKLPDALAAARAALLKPRLTASGRPWMTPAVFAAAVAALFAVGFGAGRLINAVRSGQFLVAAAPAADAATTSAPARAAEGDAGPSRADLETRPWREVAAEIDAALARDIKARAARSEARAQTLACLGHMAGAEDFLPSPSAARAQCDAAAAQHDPPGLYFSWVLHRTAPHAGVDAATARARLEEAARLGWLPAQIDYAQLLAPDAGAPLAAQAEAGRLWLAAAERGDPRGQYHYARWLRDSAAGPRDPAASVPFLERAASRGQAEAQHMLATFYRDGIGVAANPGRARALYEQAARQNHPPSMFNLADMLRRGSAADRARAVELYRRLTCMRDELQIKALAAQRLRALQESPACR